MLLGYFGNLVLLAQVHCGALATGKHSGETNTVGENHRCSKIDMTPQKDAAHLLHNPFFPGGHRLSNVGPLRCVVSIKEHWPQRPSHVLNTTSRSTVLHCIPNIVRPECCYRACGTTLCRNVMAQRYGATLWHNVLAQWRGTTLWHNVMTQP